MILKDSLYHITQKTERGYEVLLDEKHFIYQAHFPGEPVTPGVCIIQIAKELLEDHLQHDLVIRQVKNVKFLSVISPIKTPRVSYTFDKLSVLEETGECKVQIMVTAGDEVLAKLSMTVERRL
jgi:3-hydroxyacyl-[acyl-carrier-protein] dehydratase